MILVIARSYKHFKHWCREVLLNPNDRESVVYIADPHRLRGLIGNKNIEIIFLPEWYRDRSIRSIDEFGLLVKEHRRRRKDAV